MGFTLPSSRFLKRAKGIIQKPSLDMMTLLLALYQYLLEQLTSSINKIREEHGHETATDSVQHLLSRVEILSHKEETLLTKKRNKKLKSLGVPETSNIAPPLEKESRKPRNRRFTRPSARKNTNRQVNDNVVVNLSSVELTQPEKALLSRGLGFCPRHKSYDRGKLIEDNLAFNRRLRLMSHFSDCVDTRPKEKYPDFVLKSDWQPPKQGRDLETFISSVESDITSYTPPKPKHDNLSKADRGALQSLKKRDDIIIKPADNGSAVVVMDREHYISEAERQLNDSNFYTSLDHDPTLEYAKQVSDVVGEMLTEGLISEKNFNYVLVDQPKAGRFYLLPKIHKAGNPGRPIVSANGHPTEKISEFVDLHLQPHVQNLPSYLQDTTDFLRKQDALGPLPPDTLLVSMDVTSLYTNIPHQDGIQACAEVWETRTNKDPPTETLIKLLTLVLKCNNFEFNGKHYLQVQGTAMGTKMAPAYANIFMGRLENQLLMSVTLKPFSWLRFIDDIDMKWTHGRDSLEISYREPTASILQ